MRRYVQVRVFKINRIFGTKYSKTNRLQKSIKYKTNEQNRLQNIHIVIYKYKYNQVRLVLAVFTCTKLA